jgi:DNA-binding PadR family transcriptional regulator
MYPYSTPSRPLPTQSFYALLALSRAELHTYGIKDAIFKDSLGSIDISTGRLYDLVAKLHDDALIEITATKPTNNSTTKRIHYGISKYGSIRLQEELMRLDHAVKIGHANNLMDNPVPTDIQRLQLAVAAGPKTRDT